MPGLEYPFCHRLIPERLECCPSFPSLGPHVISLRHVALGFLVKEAPIGHWSQGVAFSADNHVILVTNMVEKDIQVFQWDGKILNDSGHRIKVKGGPVAIRTAE